MDLGQTVAFFGNVQCRDAHGTAVFTGSLNTSKKPLRDSQVAARRMLTVGPDVVRPSRNAILMGDAAYIIGAGFPDYWLGSLIRDNWEIHKADGLASIRTPSELLAGEPGFSAYAGCIWLKVAKDEGESAHQFNDVQLYFGRTESVPVWSVVGLGDTLYLAQSGHRSASEFTVVEARQIPQPALTTAQFKRGIYSPTDDAWTFTTVSIPALVLRWQDGFNYQSQGSVQYHRGDRQVLVRKIDASPENGSKITFDSAEHVVVSIEDLGECWSLQVRRT